MAKIINPLKARGISIGGSGYLVNRINHFSHVSALTYCMSWPEVNRYIMRHIEEGHFDGCLLRFVDRDDNIVQLEIDSETRGEVVYTFHIYEIRRLGHVRRNY